MLTKTELIQIMTAVIECAGNSVSTEKEPLVPIENVFNIVKTFSETPDLKITVTSIPNPDPTKRSWNFNF